ncbi:MAG: hypothetical protein ACI8PT_004405 [Gammaproteobacteria bacterium]|jgi:hypothetical protein
MAHWKPPLAGSGLAPRRLDAMQRFGNALNLNIHLHMLVPDGSWRFVNGCPRFQRSPAPNDGFVTNTERR